KYTVLAGPSTQYARYGSARVVGIGRVVRVQRVMPRLEEPHAVGGGVLLQVTSDLRQTQRESCVGAAQRGGARTCELERAASTIGGIRGTDDPATRDETVDDLRDARGAHGEMVRQL